MSLEIEQTHFSLDTLLVQPMATPTKRHRDSSSRSHGVMSASHHCTQKPEQDDSTAASSSVPDTTRETSFGSTRSSGHTALFIRDTSIDGGPGGVETSRITVNTHNSILNITEEDDDEEGSEIPIEKSFLFEDAEDSIILDHLSIVSDDRSSHHAAATHYCIPQSATCRSSKSSWCENLPLPPPVYSSAEMAKKDASLLDFFDGSRSTPAGGGSHSQMTRKRLLCGSNIAPVLEYDIMELLGCSNPPDQDEINRVWHFNLVPTSACNVPAVATTNSTGGGPTLGSTLHDTWNHSRKARRRQWRERAMYVHRLRIERSSSPSSVISPPSSFPIPTKCRSMDDRLWSANHDHYNTQSSAWSSAFGLFSSTREPEPHDPNPRAPSVREMDPTLLLSDDRGDGYDSDPEEHVFWPEPNLFHNSKKTSNSTRPSSRCSNSSRDDVASVHSRRSYIDASFSSSSNIFDTVQETLNMNWTVTWYPRRSNGTIGEPRTVHIWIERGTLIEMNTVMLEPNLMWRETFHPELETKRKLNKSSQKPHYIRLLNLCRVLTQDIDRKRYPLVRSSCCVLIRTSDGQEHLFETKTRSERNELVRRWKLTTARFATLAVLEDLETICKEFFSPMVTSRMLVPDYTKLDEDENDILGEVDDEDEE
ncbi:hypothetical protein ACA910_009420 [Epithemia clementina (nom. ined.)]